MKAYILITNPGETPKGKWDYGLLEEVFERNHIEQIEVDSIPEDDRAFVVIAGGGSAGKEKTINEEIVKLNKVVLFITSDECGLLNVDLIEHPDIDIWVQTPFPKHDRYHKLFLGAPIHLKENKPEYTEKKYDVYFGGQITHQRRQELAGIMSHIKNALYRPTDGFAKGDSPKDYYLNMASSRIAPTPSGAVTMDSFRFYEAIEMLSLPIYDIKDAFGVERDYYGYVYGNLVPAPSTKNWNHLQDIVDDTLEQYPANLHKVVSWWIKYKRDFSYKIMDQIYAS